MADAEAAGVLFDDVEGNRAVRGDDDADGGGRGDNVVERRAHLFEVHHRFPVLKRGGAGKRDLDVGRRDGRGADRLALVADDLRLDQSVRHNGAVFRDGPAVRDARNAPDAKDVVAAHVHVPLHVECAQVGGVLRYGNFRRAVVRARERRHRVAVPISDAHERDDLVVASR